MHWFLVAVLQVLQAPAWQELPGATFSFSSTRSVMNSQRIFLEDAELRHSSGTLTLLAGGHVAGRVQEVTT